MTLRREILGYIGTGAIGGIAGYYAGAKELLGIQSHREDRVRYAEESKETPADEKTKTPVDETIKTPVDETPRPNQSAEEKLSAPFEETFDNGLNGWTVNQRYRLPKYGQNPGDGGYSDRYGGSVRLRVDGGPSTIGTARKTAGITSGTKIIANIQIDSSGPQPGNISIAVYAPDGDDIQEERFKNSGDVTSGELEVSGVVENDYPDGTEVRVFADVWPGEFTAYVTSVQAFPSRA